MAMKINKKRTYIGVTESLSYAAETNTTLYVNYTSEND